MHYKKKGKKNFANKNKTKMTVKIKLKVTITPQNFIKGLYKYEKNIW